MTPKYRTLADRIGADQCQACGTTPGRCGNRYCSANPAYRRPRAKKRYRSMWRVDWR